ncbi:hypothetical protein A6R68_18022 [Neotoma lepida]|uniref:IF rod domain-containing protein n=1 Tax=Neotoma lepida TaxID=56216 RepID=A0A1A6HD14_NEOLE|nr:hypothetical protein A6R68_18022 [Neotoma lepida]
MPIFADDFGVKYKTELAMHQSVESDIHRLQKVVDDTSITKLQLEKDIGALKKELLFLKKNHEEEVKGFQIDHGKRMPPKSQDISKIMANIQAQYEELGQKSHEELDKYWCQLIEERCQLIEESTISAEIKDTETMFLGLRHTFQPMDIDLNFMKSQKVNLENSLRDMGA